MIVKKIKADTIKDAIKIIASSKCDEYVYEKLAKKIVGNSFVVENIDNRAANVLKQEAISCGCDVAVSKDVSLFKKGKSNIVICANTNQIEKLILKINGQPFGLKLLAQKINDINSFQLKQIVCANKKISLHKTLVTGIINLSPDSFFQNGIEDESFAAETALQMQKDGADIIDVGAESTRPGSKPVSVKFETEKIKKFLKLFRKKSKMPVSVDTYKPEVARVALAEGADIINDIYALRYKNKEMAKVVAKNNAAVVLMHMKKNPLTMQQNIRYNNTLNTIFNFLSEQINFALDSGIKKESIIIDPGIGFGKTVADNLLIIKRLFEFKALNVPLLIGLSNKSFLGEIIGTKNLDERPAATIAANIISVINGADIVRVHDVKETKKTLNVLERIKEI
ncbi:dihydropteroate synthase [Candidatus Ruminimicrobium bovinum]|uniref:dihydropteroate synthase n=1 Tax=Candidatus Ruminimicrobium bovinum TaxID=3242779 RepID=UPI0039B871D2